MVLNFLKSLFGAGTDKTPSQDAAVIAAATEEVVRGTDPRLRLVSGYTKKLRAPVERAVAYATEIVEVIPGPFEVTKKTFGSDPQVRAFFSSIEHLQDVFAKDKALRDYLEVPQHALVDHCFALLAATKTERHVLGMEREGDKIRKDVAQTTVSFGGHNFVAPAASIDALKHELSERAFDHIVSSALRRLVTLKAHTEELRERRLLLQTKLHQRAIKKRGFETLAPSALLEGSQTLELRRELENAEQGLRQTTASLGTLSDYLSQVQDVLSHPEDYIRLRPATVRLDRMGIKRKPDSSEDANDITFAAIDLEEEQDIAGILIRYSPEELPSRRPDLAGIKI